MTFHEIAYGAVLLFIMAICTIGLLATAGKDGKGDE
jgi:hypothetical protein